MTTPLPRKLYFLYWAVIDALAVPLALIFRNDLIARQVAGIATLVLAVSPNFRFEGFNRFVIKDELASSIIVTALGFYVIGLNLGYVSLNILWSWQGRYWFDRLDINHSQAPLITVVVMVLILVILDFSLARAIKQAKEHTMRAFR